MALVNLLRDGSGALGQMREGARNLGIVLRLPVQGLDQIGRAADCGARVAAAGALGEDRQTGAFSLGAAPAWSLDE